jgi:hypothetical protein
MYILKTGIPSDSKVLSNIKKIKQNENSKYTRSQSNALRRI